MIEVFTTNIPNSKEAKPVIKKIQKAFPFLSMDFEAEGPVGNYPCEHSILRVKSETLLESNKIISLLHQLGFETEVLEDNLCPPVKKAMKL
ncbi:hypothetical protein [Mesonia sp. K7]|uniref:hypothetical protein n=1 Tax=Mesonia sp. K7 TaxID=2218606 RepID=UPI000DA79E5E|nr:hypothetical protein [Mesonia sp. K7]PZD76705.1 hypothetical protein DNG35_11150 [Mesonia sp. K7]